jgi:hypothetical protein
VIEQEVKRCLEQAEAFYAPADRLHLAACAILCDVTDRRGWRQEWESFDPEIKREIVDVWVGILKAVFGEEEGTSMGDQDVREQLAAYAHQAWSGWMKYMFGKSRQRGDGSVVVPPDLVARWIRQMHTPYEELPEEEKESDRKEADEMLRIVGRERPGTR